MKHLTTRFALVLFAALPLAAADLGKYNDWDKSPQGYFMTRDERAQWERLTSAADAETFVAAFLAKRDPKFAAEVADRAAQADKYLTVGKTQGSKSLRGKAVILFGPPASLGISERAKTTTKRDNPIMAGALSNAGGAGGGGTRTGDDAATGVGSSTSTMQTVRTYSITFSGDATKKTIDRESVMFVIDVDPATGKDQFASRSAGKAAEEMFELAARASIRK